MALPLLLLLGVLAVPAGCSDPHLLRYFYTAVSEPNPELPQFTVVGYLDDQLFFQFDSAAQRAQPRAPWIQAEGSDYWDRQTWIARGWQEAFSGNVRIAMERYNQSGGLHTFQYTYGCKLLAGGGTDGFRKYGYDGRDFLSYDIHTQAWVAPSTEAVITKAKMESDTHLSQQQRDYLERKCLEWLRKYLDYGKETLQKRAHQRELAETRGERDTGDVAGRDPAQRRRDLPHLGDGGDRPPGEGPVQLPCGACEPGPATGRCVGAPTQLCPAPRGDRGRRCRSPGRWHGRVCSLEEAAALSQRPDLQLLSASASQRPGLQLLSTSQRERIQQR
uniref:MHC class I-like antigen recognition-like domain-containing protein n=1 Tax=Pelusios castaneus TaxID=367368 RepID=A0A8C8VNZ1_9SAUR